MTAGRLVDVLQADIRYAVRSLLRAPGISVIAILSLALGIGANTSVFSLLDAVFLREFPGVMAPQELIRISSVTDGRIRPHALAAADYQWFHEHAQTVDGLAAHADEWIWLTDGGDATEHNGRMVSTNYFSVLGTAPHLGRFFRSDDELATRAQPIAIIGHRLWQARFGSDPNIIGRVVTMNRVKTTIVGVTPPALAGDIWLPAAMSTGDGSYDLIGRLRQGRTLDEARAELAALFHGRRTREPSDDSHTLLVASLRGVHPAFQQSVASAPLLLIGVVGCLLLITCANLAGLLLSRGAGRSAEIATRTALGATRSRLIRQLLTESVLLALAGASAALLLSLWIQPLIERNYQYQIPGLQLELQPVAFGVTLALAALSAVTFGLVPAWATSRVSPIDALKHASNRTTGRASLRSLLIAAEVAVSLALLVGAGLLLQSLMHTVMRPGYEHSSVAQYRLRPSRLGYSVDRAKGYYDEVIRRLSGVQGVEAAVIASIPPMRGWAGSKRVRSTDPSSVAVLTENADIGPGFLSALSISLVHGREFSAQDREGAPLVAVVSQTLAQRLWQTDEALGQRLVVDDREHIVIGVARDIHTRRLNEIPPPFLYLAHAQQRQVDARLFVRVTGRARAMVSALRPYIVAVDPDVHIGQEMTLSERVALSYETELMVGRALTASGAIALILSSIGLFGMIAHSVNRRIREIGVRVALGADRRRIVALVVGQGMQPVLAGIVVGLWMALMLTNLLSGYLFGIAPRDPATFVGASTVVIVVTLLACYLPARRAAAVDPVTALRAE